MHEYMVVTGTVTYAIKGRDLLRKHGFKARIERKISNMEKHGCGYSILFKGDLKTGEQILRESGIKILQIKEI